MSKNSSNDFLIPSFCDFVTSKDDFHEILMHMENIGGSDIHIQGRNYIYIDVSGRLRRVTDRKISLDEAENIINHIYGNNATGLLQSGQPVNKAYSYRTEDGVLYRYRVNGISEQTQGKYGIQITIRTIPSMPPSVEDLGIEKIIVDNFVPEQGIIFVTGPTGSGKSTLLASGIRMVLEGEDSNKKIVTCEAPIEFVYDEVDMPSSLISQSEVPDHVENFSKGVEEALRRKPDIILIGESRDRETIEASILASQTGHLVYTTLHTNGVAETIRRLLAVFPPEERHSKQADLIDSTKMIVSQRLVKSLDGGRVPLKEYLVFTNEIRERLLSVNPDMIASETRKIMKELGQGMALRAREKYIEGIISEEVYLSIARSFNSYEEGGKYGQ